jgi:SET domain-containing protein
MIEISHIKFYANQDIKKNEEVTTSYLCGGVNYDKRQEKLFEKISFSM